MKKCFPVLMLVTLVLLGLADQALAADTEWKLKLNADRTITESVSTDPAQPGPYDNSWKADREAVGLILNREFPAWQAYNNEQDRLPLQITIKDYYLWQEVDIAAVAQQNAQTGVFASTVDKPLRVIIQLPGAISYSNADKVEDGRTAVWQITQGRDLQDKGVLLQATLIDGFIVGILLFVFGFTAIAIIFMRKISRTHKLIEEEYSLENIDREYLQDDDQDIIESKKDK